MIVLAGADIVLPDRVLAGGSVLVEGAHITAIEPRAIDTPAGATRVDLAGHLVVPGFIDVHVHGVQGCDVLDGDDAVAVVAARLPQYGVTAFCPTSIACRPAALATMLGAVARSRGSEAGPGARVLPAHLESNFINPEYNGAQPLDCIRRPPARVAPSGSPPESGFAAREILDTISAHRASVGIVTLAPEIEGGLELACDLVKAGHIVSIGHSGATYDEARAAIAAGVRHATHLFNRMTPMSHRSPGVAGAVLEAGQVVAELICDGFHVHPALMRVAIRAKGLDGIVAITDGTAGSGLPAGSRTTLGGRPIVVTERYAELDDGTLAGSLLTMDGAFRTLVRQVGLTVVEAARLCASSPARQLGLTDTGRVELGARADLVVMDEHFRVTHTCLAGRLWRNPAAEPLV
ncbi:MAG TPA: N-acetylglucosamine-6-phosphate deacetylase [Vicinamibacterales bacterium]|nr:N-acetylglucosamine-6-phosphate deacetylase [Vicinamibacterales bacterium]